MKRRVLFIFILIFWMITLSTFLSIRIETWMMPYISMTATNPKDVNKEIPADSLFYDDMGMHIYRTRNGQGWEPGLRIWEVQQSDYFIIDGKVRFEQSAGDFIQYATRTLRIGEEVRQPESAFLTADDNWVAVFPDGIPEYTLKVDTMSVEIKTENSMVVCVPGATSPFMEDRARSTVIVEKEDFEWYEPHTSSFYSLGDLKAFMKNIVLLGVLAAMMFFTIILWAWSFFLSRDYITNKKLLVINGGTAAGLLALSPLLLHFIDLPASLLPQYHITDFPHYSRVFGKLFEELNRLTDAGSEIAAAAIRQAEWSLVLFFILLALGIVCGIAWILAEIAFGKGKRKGKHLAK